MLVLNRKAGQRIVIGDAIIITVAEVHGQNVRVGISAPANVRIRREESEPETQSEGESVLEWRGLPALARVKSMQVVIAK